MSAPRVHGHATRRTPTYRSWALMVQRCTDSRRASFRNYGGRGIAVCRRWRESFSAFLADAGERPPGHELDRVDNEKGYEPGNVQWSSKKTQANNRRTNRFIEHDGKRLTVTQWAEALGLNRMTIYTRLARGWTPEQALSI